MLARAAEPIGLHFNNPLNSLIGKSDWEAAWCCSESGSGILYISNNRSVAENKKVEKDKWEDAHESWSYQRAEWGSCWLLLSHSWWVPRRWPCPQQHTDTPAPHTWMPHLMCLEKTQQRLLQRTSENLNHCLAKWCITCAAMTRHTGLITLMFRPL